MKVLGYVDNWDPGHAVKSFSRGEATCDHLPPAGGFSHDVEGVQVGQARGGLLQQSDGLQAEVVILLFHVLQEVQRRGLRGPKAQLLSTLLSSLFKSDLILFRNTLPEGFCFN